MNNPSLQHPEAHHLDGVERARRIADAVLYEGYVLFPYHAAATKNRYRWQFGVLVPPSHADPETSSSETSTLVSEVLLQASAPATVEVVVRCLHPRRRQVERLSDGGHFVPVDELHVDGALHTTWEEGREHEQRIGPHALADLLARGPTTELRLDGLREHEALRNDLGDLVGRLVHTSERVDLEVEVQAEALDTDVSRVTTRVRNLTEWHDPTASRAEVVRHGVAGTHLVLTAHGGRFASAIDPPEWAAPWAERCRNLGTYPVLIGASGGAADTGVDATDRFDDRTDEVMLSAPIILHDHPEVAEESPGDAYDATEIHELLSLCTTALTEDEKRAARATDPRAAAVIDQADHLPPEILDRLHGAIRDLHPASVPSDEPGPAAQVSGTRLNEPGAGNPIAQELAEFLGVGEEPRSSIDLGGVLVNVGDRVRLQPGRRADAQDVFVEGRFGVVERIVETLEGEVQVGVTLEDDPAAEMHRWYGRFLYFHLDEIAVPSGREGGRVR